MSLEKLKELIPDYAKDTRLNLGTILSDDGAPGLTLAQIWSIALGAAYATKDHRLIEALEHEAVEHVPSEAVQAAKAAASVMAMNNVYYRGLHLIDDPELSKLPARLRMNVIGKPGIAKIDFELICFAISAQAGCGMCLKAHAHEIEKAGLPIEAQHSALRIASVIQSSAQALATP